MRLGLCDRKALLLPLYRGGFPGARGTVQSQWWFRWPVGLIWFSSGGVGAWSARAVRGRGCASLLRFLLFCDCAVVRLDPVDGFLKGDVRDHRFVLMYRRFWGLIWCRLKSLILLVKAAKEIF